MDYTAIDSYKHQWADPLLTRVLALTGEKDEAANEDTMYGWRHFVACCEEEEGMEGGMEGGLGGAPKVYVLKKKGKYRCRREGGREGGCLFRQVVLPGTHFFIKDRPEAVWGMIQEEIKRMEG